MNDVPKYKRKTIATYPENKEKPKIGDRVLK